MSATNTPANIHCNLTVNDLNLLIKHSPLSLFLLQTNDNMGLHFVYLEGQLSSELGLNDQKYLNISPLQVFNSDLARQSIVNAFNGLAGSFEFRKRNRYYQVLLTPVMDDNKVLEVAGTIQEVTEKRKAERYYSLMAHALTSLSDAVSITDADDNFLYVNKVFTKLYGYSNEELEKAKSNLLWSPSNPTHITDQILPNTLKGGWEGYLFNKNKFGNDFLIHLRTSAVFDANNEIIGCVGIAREVDEKNKAEAHKFIFP